MRFGIVAPSRLKPNIGLKPVVVDIAGVGQEQVLATDLDILKMLSDLRQEREQFGEAIIPPERPAQGHGKRRGRLPGSKNRN